MYDKITKQINDRRNRYGIASINEPITDYHSFDLDNNGNLNFKSKHGKIYIGNINKGLKLPSKIIQNLGVNRLQLMGFSDITYLANIRILL